LCLLASGSAGNAAYLEHGGQALLVDCGLTVPELRRRLASAGCDEKRIAALVITHDHSDHTGSAGTLARKLEVPLYATAGTLAAFARLPAALARPVQAGEPFDAAGFRVHAFSTPHDATDPVALRIEAADGRAAGIATDMGYVSRSVVENLCGVHLLVAEHNHDRRMLVEGPYPAPLKRRILGSRGHLSNEEGAQLAGRVVHAGLRRVVLGHLSQTNNTPDLARAAFDREHRDSPASLALSIAAQDAPSEVFDV